MPKHTCKFCGLLGHYAISCSMFLKEPTNSVLAQKKWLPDSSETWQLVCILCGRSSSQGYRCNKCGGTLLRELRF